MRRRAVTRVLALVLVATGAWTDAAQAGRLDVAGRALREPGVWVDADLAWLVSPAAARRLDREIDRAHVPVRVAVLPQLAVDESRGDRRAIARALIRRVGRDGLYVLVDQDGDVAYAARRLPFDTAKRSFPDAGGRGDATLAEALAALVPTVRAARGEPPVSIEPYSDPRGVTTSPHRNHDSLLVIALLSGLVGLLLGVGSHVCVRAIAGAASAWRQRA